MKKLKVLVFGLIGLMLSCSSEDDSVTDPKDDKDLENSISIQLTSNATFGNIITDENGISLYYFSKDVKGDSECVDGCLAAWPLFYEENLKLGEGLETTDFGVITRADGAMQNTYKGWPLYYFASDTAAGDTKGDGVGDNWYIAKPDFSLMYAQADIDGESTFYMTNATGRTIYLFANDTKDDNNFTNEDFSNDGAWPVISIDISHIPSILDINDFGTIDVFGTTQVTYKGWPLYYFGNDVNRGDANGVSDVWPIVNVDTPNAPEVNQEASVKLTSNATFGNILTDANGISLYYFSKDVKGDSECAGGCLAAWPLFYDENLIVDEGLEAADFGVITREDGAKQNTYKGWPLYYFGSDTAAGETKGDGVGDNWYIAKPDYSLMYAQADIDGTSTFYMTNATGRTIYLYANDTKDDNNFTNEDFSNDGAWPVIRLDISQIPSILDINDFGTIDVFGTTQVTYKGWPLYYFGNDAERGDVNGVSGVWPIINVETPSAE
ncbi:hypothetical protein [uncultured Maribacter sp.]|uniref:hypothetical protein n=1 Tax=uncultured Maribacter sp. TaxID=431308 RepID=UPI0026065CA9|nr:hypothetical protein [uncultured Maribacter sp.]